MFHNARKGCSASSSLEALVAEVLLFVRSAVLDVFRLILGLTTRKLLKYSGNFSMMDPVFFFAACNHSVFSIPSGVVQLNTFNMVIFYLCNMYYSLKTY